MKNRFSIFVILILTAIGPTSFAGSVQVKNAGADFQSFLSSVDAAKSFESAWNDLEVKYSEIYDHIYRKDIQGWETRRQKRLTEFQKQLPLLRNGMNAFFLGADVVVNKKYLEFSQVFSDVRDGITVFIIPSLFSFNGQVTDLPASGTSLLIGADVIVDRSDDLDVLFSHEFFHVYQSDRLAGKQTWQTFATPIWNEGFPTYVSGILNPQKLEAVLLMDSDLAISCGSKVFVSGKASEFLKVIDLSAQDFNNETVYNEWFTMKSVALPHRAGYCLGLRAMQFLSKQHLITEMVSWDEQGWVHTVMWS